MTTIVNKMTAFLTLTVLLLSLCLTGCQIFTTTPDPHADSILLDYNSGEGKESAPLSVGVFDADDMIHQEGSLLKTAGGETVYLRGVNLGSYFVTEAWMTRLMTSADYKTRTKILLSRFGEEKTLALWEEWRNNWFSDEDFKLLKDMGANVIRLPITYMNVDFNAIYDYNLAAYEYDFSEIDEFVEKAASYGIYTILDLHGAYGSQNGADHSGESKSPADIDFYYNEQMMQLTVDLWRAMAEHYKDNPAVAAYDILNEPGEHKEGGGTMTTTTRHFEFMDRAYEAIREVDTNHVVIFESCWDAGNLPMPSEYGWENCMYSFHHYTNKYGSDPSAHNKSMKNKIDSILNKNFGVPIQMGEFTCYDNKEQWEYTLNYFNEHGIHWCNWTYKLHRNAETMRFWGYVNVTADESLVDINTASYDEILSSFSLVKTGEGTTKIPAFDDGTSFFDLLAKYLRQ
jgi:aryl-phospho-beta-D-glucosidase BglC (GH1 family)